jgi:hypothetical protein
MKSYLQKAFNPFWCELSFPRRRESTASSCILAISHCSKDSLSLRTTNGSAASFSPRRIASQEGCRALLAMTVEPFRRAGKAKHKKAQWIPACAGMTVQTKRDKILYQQPLRLGRTGLFKRLCLK